MDISIPNVFKYEISFEYKEEQLGFFPKKKRITKCSFLNTNATCKCANGIWYKHNLCTDPQDDKNIHHTRKLAREQNEKT